MTVGGLRARNLLPSEARHGVEVTLMIAELTFGWSHWFSVRVPPAAEPSLDESFDDVVHTLVLLQKRRKSFC